MSEERSQIEFERGMKVDFPDDDYSIEDGQYVSAFLQNMWEFYADEWSLGSREITNHR